MPWRGDKPPYHTGKDAGIEGEANDGLHDSVPETVTPYHTWVSEVMSQQTTLAAVVPYYLKFITAFPNIASLALAEAEEVNAKWSGLGYMTRARNLHAGAKDVMERFGGILPSKVDELKTIAGIGPYTAGGERRAVEIPKPLSRI